MRSAAILLLAVLGAADDADALIARAEAQGLARDPYWSILLHAEGGASQVDDPAFFLAPEGKANLAAELRATIRGLLAPPSTGGRHAFDRFPARCEWLIRILAIERGGLPVPRCTAFEDQLAPLASGTATLVFPSALIGSPASMFGHTLLVVRPAGVQGMAGTAITYAAVTPDEDPLSYAVKGLSGGYPGYFSVLPYWQKLAEYRDIDQRDLWEYELDLTPAEIRRLLLHVWEMRGIRSDYWFFTENCAYVLLWVLDAGRPEARLHTTPPWWKWWVIPIDTVRAMREAGMVRQAARRPSLASQVRSRVAELGPGRAADARAIALGEAPPQGDAGTLDLAALWLQARRNRLEVGKDDYQQRLVPLLAARARLGPAAPAPAARPEGRTPDHGHGSLRITAGGGSSGDALFAEAGLRFAYHDVLDPDWGHPPGSQIQFGNLVLRAYDDEQRPTVERLDIVDVKTLTPRNGWFPAWSWQGGGGIVRERVGDGAEHHLAVVYGFGAALGLPGGGLAYALADVDGRIVDLDPQAAAGGGPEAGALIRCGEALLLAPAAWWRGYLGDRQGGNWSLGMKARWTVHPDLALSAEAARTETWDCIRTELALRLSAYF